MFERFTDGAQGALGIAQKRRRNLATIMWALNICC